MHQRWLPTVFLAVLVASSCDNDETSLSVDPPAPTTEELIIADCYVVRDALEAFAAENGGDYPRQSNEPSDAGNLLVTFLPGGTRLTNRYTGLATAPTFGNPQWPGEIGVVPFGDGYSENGCTCDPTGYRIVARGRYDELVRIENVAAIDPRTITAIDSVLANLETALATAHEYARRNGGVYAADVGADALPNGDVFTDLLPGGMLMTNPYWGGQDSPVDGSAAGPGQIGYQPQDRNGDGWWDGFIIDALGPDGATVIALRTRDSLEDEDVRSAFIHMRDAVEDFASQNAGEYPRDLDTDETPSGDTLRDLLFNSLNPYTGAPAYRDGLATSRGEVGYVGLEYNGIVVGYVINAVGLFDEELERFEVLTN
ncbi:MAG TPA: hypothetical protein VEC56_00230 [Candidatus Krumholzibacteria bacterium]|nr:hypothetical protein [Candidatus Krumholzibacteria bacterium]